MSEHTKCEHVPDGFGACSLCLQRKLDAAKAREKALREGAISVLAPLVQHPERNPHAVRAPAGCLCRWCKASRWLTEAREAAALAVEKEQL